MNQSPAEIFPHLGGRFVRELFRGGQATISLLSAAEGVEIVVKEYKPGLGVLAALDEEVVALSRLGVLVNDRTVHGWRVQVPKVLDANREPPALALTRVPGRPLEELLKEGCAASNEIAHAFAEILQRYWKDTGRPLGDVNLSNLLCMPEGRTLAVVDPGLPHRNFEVEDVSQHFYPASRDLGCLLHQVCSTNVSRRIWSRSHATARLRFVRNVIAACIPTPGDRDSLLQEIADCAHVHLSRVRGGGVLHGPWRTAVRRSASHALMEEVSLMRKFAPCI